MPWLLQTLMVDDVHGVSVCNGEFGGGVAYVDE